MIENLAAEKWGGPEGFGLLFLQWGSTWIYIPFWVEWDLHTFSRSTYTRTLQAKPKRVSPTLAGSMWIYVDPTKKAGLEGWGQDENWGSTYSLLLLGIEQIEYLNWGSKRVR